MATATKPTASKPTATKAKPASAKRKEQSSIGLWLVGGAVLILAIVVVILIVNQNQGTTPVAAPEVATEWVQGTTMGNPAAAVTIQMWEDFLCPACQQWTAQVKPQLMEEFVKPGLVRVEFHQFPLNQHAPGAQMGAQASLCAADQNQFWPYHDQLFRAASTRGQAGMTYDAMLQYAADLGLNLTAFTQCVNALTHQNDVVESLNQATQLNLSSTPSILINGKLMPSPFNYNELKAEIESHLAAGS